MTASGYDLVCSIREFAAEIPNPSERGTAAILRGLPYKTQIVQFRPNRPVVVASLQSAIESTGRKFTALRKNSIQ
jgi:hypothetical protein